MIEKLLPSIGKWSSEYDENGVCTKAVYDDAYLALLGIQAEEDDTDSANVWTESVHPDDIARIEENAAELFSKHPEGMDYDLEYRMMTPSGYHWFHDYGLCSRREDGSVERIDGVIFDIQDIVDKDETQKALAEMNARILALEDDFESLYDVDLESGIYTNFAKGELFRSTDAENPVPHGNFFEEMPETVDNLVVPEDREGLRTVLTREAIKTELPDNGHFDYYFRAFTHLGPQWYSLRIAYKDEEKKHVIVGIFNAEKDFEAQQLADQKSAMEESMTFVNYFLDTYISAYYIDINTREYKSYKAPSIPDDRFSMSSSDYLQMLTGFAEKSVVPEDIDEFISLIQPEKIRELLNKGGCLHTFRDNFTGSERVIRMQMMPGADCDHATLAFKDITEEIKEQEKRLLGAVPISPDILAKENIGMWAFELDEGQPPRMYGDDAMIKLVGLDHQVPPEEMYHAWYDHIDEGSYGLVADAVEKMMSGEHAEVQYPWHHPDGHTMIVRCGGISNPEYTKGIRVEGTHQNVTEVLHYDEAEIERLKNTEIKLQHEHLRSEVLNYMIDKEDDPIELLKNYAERLRELIGCDQVIYRDLEETRIMVNSPEIEKTWSVPIEYCRQCEHFDAHHPMYAGGYTEMDNCQDGWQGIPVYKDCPIKSSLTRIIYCDGKVAGYLAIHYVQNYHHFTEIERVTLEEFARILSISISRYEAKKRAGEADSVRKMMNMLFSLSSEYDPIIVVEPESGEYDWYMGQADELTVNTSMTLHGDSLYKNIGIDSASIIHPDDRAQFRAFYTRENMCRIAETGEPQETENRWFLKLEGRYKWKYNKAVRMIDDEGKVYVVIGVIDTTEEKEKEDQLVQKTILSNHFLKSYTAAYYADLSKKKLEILHIEDNDAVKIPENDIVESKDIISFIVDNYVVPEDRERTKMCFSGDYIKQRMEETDEFSFTFRVLHNGELKTYRSMVIPGNDENHVAIGIQNITEDVKAQQEQQRQLEEALAMAQSANRAKTTFLNNMSHDIRTPMNAIIGYTGLAASHIDKKEQVQDYLSKIAQSSNHLLSLINDVLDMSRIESGKMNIDEKPENLPSIVHTLRDIVQADIRSKQHDFFIDTVNVKDENIICDKLRLNQVLLNILSNAIKYTPQGGTISMRITEKTVKPNGYATYEFCIKDNGMGMDKDYLATLFDPFTRVKSSTVSGIQGTGLGMAISKNIIDMMGGRIDVQSEPGIGTEVTVTFDFRLQEHHKETIMIAELEGFRGLVVDDDANTVMSIASMLSEIGMRPDWCVSGKEAVLRAEYAHRSGDSFKVYIIDWLMPDMNGIETTRRIRKVIGDDAPIIILTAYDWTDIEEEAREAGVTAFVSKPLFPSDLENVLNTCLGREEKKQVVPEDDYDFTGRRILLVEDNDLNREIATEILEEIGFEVDTAEDGDIAVEIMRKAGPGVYDLILMDIQMPRMDGFQATRLIRALPPEDGHIPIIAMTANAFEEDRKAAIEAGMDEHIAKPIDVAKLKSTLAKFL